jgi:hypothetical protein
MIQDSNAPNDMQPWVRQTEAEVDALKKTVERLSVQLQNAGIGSDVILNSALNDTFNFSPQEDGSTSTTAGALEFDGVVSTLQPLNVQNSLVVGERTELIESFNEEIGETVLGTGESAPYMEITPGSLEVNPVTEQDFYTPGTFKINDTSININGYGQISGDGLAITLSNPSAIAGYRADVLDVTSGVIYQENPTSEEGDPGDEVPVTIYEVEHNGENIEIIGVGQYVNITGCEPEELNESDALIVEIDLDPGVYLKFKILKDSSAITYVAGGEVSSNKPNEVYQSTLSVRGPGGANEFFGATVGPEGISVGPDGGNFGEAFSSLGREGLITPSVTAIDSFTLNNTRVFIQSNEPDTPFEGDLWINPQSPASTEDPIFTGETTGPRLRLTATDGADLTSTDHGFQLGSDDTENLVMDRNSIMARNNGSAGIIRINENGGNIELGDSSSTITGDGKLSIGNVGTLTSGFVTAASGWALSGTSQYRERNGIAMVSIGLTRTGGSISVPTGGNITNTTVATLGVGYRPIIEGSAVTGPSGPAATAYISTSGSVVLSAISGGNTIPTGFDIDLNGTFIVA